MRGFSWSSRSTVVSWSSATWSRVSPSSIVYVRRAAAGGWERVVAGWVVVRAVRVAAGGCVAVGSPFESSPARISSTATVAAARKAAGASRRAPQCVSRARGVPRGTSYQPEAAQTSLFSRAASEPAAVRQSASE
jgi:hypothetical protein